MQSFKTAFALLPALALFPAAGQTPPLGVAPQLVLSTNYVPAVIGSTSPSVTVEAYNAGAGSLNLTATASAPWLSAGIGALGPCTSRAGNCYPITISFNAQLLSPGTYTEYITVTDPNAIDSPQQITVNVTVGGIPTSLNLYATPANAPVGITSPLYTPVLVTSVDQPWLSVNDLIGKPGSPPYTVEARALPNMAEGTYTGKITIQSIAGTAVNNMGIQVTFTITSAPIAQIRNTPVQIIGDQGGPGVTTRVPVGNIGLGQLSLNGATASSTPGNFLSVSVSSDVTVDITANPGSLAPGIYAGTVTVSSNAVNNSQISIPVEFTVNLQGIPQISAGGIVEIATYIPDIALGDILAIFGDQLAPPGAQSQNPGPPPLATKLGNTQVLVNGVAAPLYFVSPGQINFQLSYGAPLGLATVQVVSNGIAGNIRSINVTATSPRILTWPAAIIAGTYGIIVNADGSLTLPSGTSVPSFNTQPAKAGDTIVIYCVGFGQTSPPATDGAAAGSNPTQQVQPVTVEFGGPSNNVTRATSSYAGLTPTSVGLYQVNVTIPPNTPTGATVPITIGVNGRGINSVNMAISQ